MGHAVFFLFTYLFHYSVPRIMIVCCSILFWFPFHWKCVLWFAITNIFKWRVFHLTRKRLIHVVETSIRYLSLFIRAASAIRYAVCKETSPTQFRTKLLDVPNLEMDFDIKIAMKRATFYEMENKYDFAGKTYHKLIADLWALYTPRKWPNSFIYRYVRSGHHFPYVDSFRLEAMINMVKMYGENKRNRKRISSPRTEHAHRDDVERKWA